MRPRTLGISGVFLALAVLSAGCLGGGPSAGDTATQTPTPKTTATPAPTATPEPTDTPTPAPTNTPTPAPTETLTSTATATWSKPQPPNAPESKYDETDRIWMYDTRLVNRERSANGDGVTDFDIEVTANTTMSNVDPPEHGDVEGEPYFLAYANDRLIYRSEPVDYRNGTFTLDVHPGALEQFEEGTLRVTVFLMDRDSTYDDEYAYETARIRYAGESE